jgi:hypothetical protein
MRLLTPCYQYRLFIVHSDYVGNFQELSRIDDVQWCIGKEHFVTDSLCVYSWSDQGTNIRLEEQKTVLKLYLPKKINELMCRFKSRLRSRSL